MYSDKSPMTFSEEEGGIVTISLHMPFVDPGDVELFKGAENNITLKVGSQNRTVSLPMSLQGAEVMGAELEDDILKIKFKKEEVKEESK